MLFSAISQFVFLLLSFDYSIGNEIYHRRTDNLANTLLPRRHLKPGLTDTLLPPYKTLKRSRKAVKEKGKK